MNTREINTQKFVVSEYFAMNLVHPCMTWAISTITSLFALILDGNLLSKMSSYVCLILVTRSPMDASRFACDRISCPKMRKSKSTEKDGWIPWMPWSMHSTPSEYMDESTRDLELNLEQY